MMTRRGFIGAGAAAAGSVLAAVGCSVSDEEGYLAAVRSTWRHAEGSPEDRSARMLELVRYATLAPSSHNTQCWRFRLAETMISILPDFRRRCPVVDPDDHHLFVSLGCAAENLVQAASAHGLRAAVMPGLAADQSIQVELESTQPSRSALFQAIPSRQCTRTDYDGKPLSNDELKRLEQVAAGTGVQLLLLTDRAAMEKVLQYVVAGNTAQVQDGAFVRELKRWVRFNDAEAIRTGDGLFARSSGNPVAPRWLGSLLFDVFFTASRENDKYANNVRSSAGIAVFASDANDKVGWIQAGRCYQRFALQATAMGVRTAHLNQPVEVSALRPEFAKFLGVGQRRPDLVVRFGRGPEAPWSLRRPLKEVLI